ncbi:MAG TPA: transaldolase [Bdellovibrionales bacterium]|nr:MAG: transaldolase [Bdellovibrionales bacterium GWB1_52_6]OFZ05725.1 MAG: transaldolase [Bdellovibrionales bacterium GWA1_52_35]HAR41304.1 transaldolase [Bdellovibrionales bacterium]HCM40335.1 transaldolase [Bdellovibrionales bacterium]
MLRIKIFLDGADRPSMLEMNKTPLVAGFTTNPSLMRKAGVKDYRAYCQDLLTQISKPISFEVFADDFAAMNKQALEIKTWGENVYVKIPITNSKGESAIPLIRELSHSGVKLNVTALYTIKQVWETAQAVQGGAPSIASVFAGRTGDVGHDPIPIMLAAAEICRTTDKNIELLWASTREAFNVIQAEQCGCQIITAPGDVIKKVAGFGKDLTQLSLETVQTFKTDSDAAGFFL